MAKVCITSIGPTLDSPVDPRFGRAAFFIFLDEKGNIEESVPNPGVEAFRGAGIAAAQEVVKRKVDSIISGNIGPSAFSVLQASGVKIFLSPVSVSVKEGFRMWKDNKLSSISGPSATGFGRGYGRGWGRGFFGRRRGF